MIKELGGSGDVPRRSLAPLDGVFLCAARTPLPSQPELLPRDKVKARGSSLTDTSRKSSVSGKSAVVKEMRIPAQGWGLSDVHEAAGEGGSRQPTNWWEEMRQKGVSKRED